MKLKDKPLVSVVMPAHNSEKYVAEAIESILNQTYKNFEFIIIDDGSTDNTLKIIKKYARKDKRIKVMDNKVNFGICKTLNKGIKEARGKYIARADSDDISLPKRFEEQIIVLENSPKIGVIGAGMELFNDKGRIGIRTYPKDDKELRRKIFFYSPFAHPVVMIRKESFKSLEPYNPLLFLAEDLDLWFRIGEVYKFHNIKKILLKYRINEKSETISKLRLMEKRANKVRWKNWNNPKYNFGFKAFLYNLFHLISIYTIPSKLKLWLFRKMRDERR